MKSILVFFFCLSTTLAFSQKWDSLSHAYRHASTHFNRANISYEQGRHLFFEGRKTESLPYFQIALEHAQKTDSISFKGDCFFWLGYVHYQLGNHSIAIGDLVKAKHTYREIGLSEMEAKSAVLAGKVLMYSGQLLYAKEFFESAQVFFTFHQEHPDYASFIWSYGDLLKRLGRNHEALTYYTFAQHHYETEKQPINLARVELDMGLALRAMGKYSRALDHFLTAQRISETENSSWLKCLAQSNLGRIHELTGEYKTAEGLYRSAISLAQQFEMERYEVYPLQYLVGMLVDQGRTQELGDHVTRLGEVIPEVTLVADKERAQQILLEAHKALGQFSEALALAEIISAGKISLSAVEDSVRKAEVGAAYEKVMLAHENQNLAASIDTKNERLRTDEFLHSLAILLILGLAIGGLQLYKKLKAQERATAKAIVHVTQAEEKVLAAETQAEKDRKRMESLFSLNRKAQENIIKIGRVGEDVD